MRVCSIILPRQVVVSGGKAKALVLVDFHELAARTEEQHRAELWVEATAQDEFVAVERDHRLDGHPQEVLGTYLLADRCFNSMVGAAHGVRSDQMYLHAAHVALVRNRF